MRRTRAVARTASRRGATGGRASGHVHRVGDLAVSAGGAVHVGDLRRSDVAGARAAGMGTVRFRGRHDDADDSPSTNAGVIDCAAAGCDPICERPEADVVVDSYVELANRFGLSVR